MGQSGPWWGIPWWVWGLGCLAVGSVYAWVESPAVGPPWAQFWLRWGHSICWGLLATSFFLRLGNTPTMVHGLAIAGGLSYGAFLILKVVYPTP